MGAHYTWRNMIPHFLFLKQTCIRDLGEMKIHTPYDPATLFLRGFSNQTLAHGHQAPTLHWAKPKRSSPLGNRSGRAGGLQGGCTQYGSAGVVCNSAVVVAESLTQRLVKHTKEDVCDSFPEKSNSWQNWAVLFEGTDRGGKTYKTEIIVTKVNLPWPPGWVCTGVLEGAGLLVSGPGGDDSRICFRVYAY